jgi:hypothetical protein
MSSATEGIRTIILILLDEVLDESKIGDVDEEVAQADALAAFPDEDIDPELLMRRLVIAVADKLSNLSHHN